MLKKSLKRPCTSGAGTLTSFGFTVSRSENSDKSETESICDDEPQSPAKRLKAQHHRASGFDPEWPKSYPWVEEFQNGIHFEFFCFVFQIEKNSSRSCLLLCVNIGADQNIKTYKINCDEKVF